MTDYANPDQGTIAETIDQLISLVGRGRAMPMSASVLVNREEVAELLERARAALPAQLSHADDLLSDADSTLARAQEQASEILIEARREAAQLTDEHRIVAEATERAEQILNDAHRAADNVRRNADEYCDRKLEDFEIDMQRLIAQVQAGRAKLAKRLEAEQ